MGRWREGMTDGQGRGRGGGPNNLPEELALLERPDPKYVRFPSMSDNPGPELSREEMIQLTPSERKRLRWFRMSMTKSEANHYLHTRDILVRAVRFEIQVGIDRLHRTLAEQNRCRVEVRGEQ